MTTGTTSDWKLSAKQDVSTADSFAPVRIGNLFSSHYVACKIIINNPRPSWVTAGRLWVGEFILGEYHLSCCFDLKIAVPRLITIPCWSSDSYALFYEPPKWFTNIKIKIWSNKNMALYNTNTNVTPLPLTSSVAVTSVIQLPGNAPATEVLVNNTYRLGYSIRNKAVKPVLIGFSANLSSANAFLSLDAGAVYEAEEDYIGSVYVRPSATNAPVDLVITEFKNNPPVDPSAPVNT